MLPWTITMRALSFHSVCNIQVRSVQVWSNASDHINSTRVVRKFKVHLWDTWITLTDVVAVVGLHAAFLVVFCCCCCCCCWCCYCRPWPITCYLTPWQHTINRAMYIDLFNSHIVHRTSLVGMSMGQWLTLPTSANDSTLVVCECQSLCEQLIRVTVKLL